MTLFFIFFGPSFLFAKARKPEPGKSQETYSLTQAKPIPIDAKKTKLPLIIYGEETGAIGMYVPSGYMGDTGSLKVKSAGFSAPLTSSKTGTTCLKVEVRPKGREGWAGIYWQTPANNWGKIKGAGYDLTDAKQLTFWARGEKGGEKIAEAKVGGLIGPYPDTDAVSIGPLRLTKEWQQYAIHLEDADLRHIIGGFAFILRRSDNPRGAIFYLDEIMFQGDIASATIASTSIQQMQVSSAPTTPPSPTSLWVPMLKTPLRTTIPFPTTRTVLSKEGRNVLDEIAAVAQKYPTCKLQVEGHTDNIGPKELNKKLSFQRAQAVADYLKSKGVEEFRLCVVGHGDEQPLFAGSNDTREGRLKNRRVEIILMPN